MSTPKTHNPKEMVEDMALGFQGFVDRVLRGRDDKTIFNTSVGLSALEIGVKTAADSEALRWEFFPALINNKNLDTMNFFSAETTHEFMNLSDGIFMGFDFPDFFGQFLGQASEHGVPLYSGTLASEIGLPDLPYGGMAHMLHIGMALYDTGRTFKDLWDDPALHHNVLKIMTHPELGHTLAHKGTMLTVMGLLHPLGPIVSIGMAYLCGHLVHSFFQLLEQNREAFQHMKEVPVLAEIYNATGIKEWSEARDASDQIPEQVDPYDEQWEDTKPHTKIAGERRYKEPLEVPALLIGGGA